MHEPATIFVLIASYRDPECSVTVSDMFDKAREPNRVYAGICWQYASEDEFDCLDPSLPLRNNIRVDRVPHTESHGVCWARHRAQLLYQDQDYVLVIDSHMRFEPDWDAKLIAELNQCPAEKSILSSYPPGFTLPETKEFPPPMVNQAQLNIRRYPAPDTRYPDGNIRGYVGYMLEQDNYIEPLRCAFFAAGFSFMPALALKEVPFDPYIDWDEEEISFSVRLWTFGWAFYAPREHLLHHLYVSNRPSGNAQNFRLHVDKSRLVARFERSKKRYFHMLGLIETTDKEALSDISQYGLGSSRSLRDFEAFSGIYLQSQKVTVRAPERWFALTSPAHPHNQRQDQLLEVFSKKHSQRGASVIDPGSTLQITKNLRASLVDLFAEFEVRSLLDIACGISDWIGPADLPVERYVGADFVPEIVQTLSNRYAKHDKVEYIVMDVRSSPLRAYDIVLLRDCLTSFSYRDVGAALQNIKNSGSRFLITSHYTKLSKAAKIKQNLGFKSTHGEWNRLNLMMPPYYFPKPERIIDDQPSRDKFLAMWRVADMPDLTANPTVRIGRPLSNGLTVDKMLNFDETEYLSSLRYADCCLGDEHSPNVSLNAAALTNSTVFRDIRDRVCSIYRIDPSAVEMRLERHTEETGSINLFDIGSANVVLIALMKSDEQVTILPRAGCPSVTLANGTSLAIDLSTCAPDQPLEFEVCGSAKISVDWSLFVISEQHFPAGN